MRTWPIFPGDTLDVQIWTSTSRLAQVIVWQRDTDTDTTKIICHAAWPVVNRMLKLQFFCRSFSLTMLPLGNSIVSYCYSNVNWPEATLTSYISSSCNSSKEAAGKASRRRIVETEIVSRQRVWFPNCLVAVIPTARRRRLQRVTGSNAACAASRCVGL